MTLSLLARAHNYLYAHLTTELRYVQKIAGVVQLEGGVIPHIRFSRGAFKDPF